MTVLMGPLGSANVFSWGVLLYFLGFIWDFLVLATSCLVENENTLFDFVPFYNIVFLFYTIIVIRKGGFRSQGISFN